MFRICSELHFRVKLLLLWNLLLHFIFFLSDPVDMALGILWWDPVYLVLWTFILLWDPADFGSLKFGLSWDPGGPRSWGSWILIFCFIVGSWRSWILNFCCHEILKIMDPDKVILLWDLVDIGSWRSVLSSDPADLGSWFLTVAHVCSQEEVGKWVMAWLR